MSKAQQKNHHLEPFNILIGKWKCIGSHPAMPGVVVKGEASFEWLEGGAFVIMRSHIDHKDFPDGVAIFGSDDSNEEFVMNYFDERNVSRKYLSTIKNSVWKWWRDDKEFSQRCTCDIQENGNKIVAKGEMSRKGHGWEKDLELTYTKVID
jgi:hypothetical protein